MVHGVASLPAKDGGPKAKAEDVHADAAPPRGEEVAGLVNKDDEANPKQDLGDPPDFDEVHGVGQQAVVARTNSAARALACVSE